MLQRGTYLRLAPILGYCRQLGGGWPRHRASRLRAKGEVPRLLHHCRGAGGPSAPWGGRAPRRRLGGDDAALLRCCPAAWRAHLKRTLRQRPATRSGLANRASLQPCMAVEAGKLALARTSRGLRPRPKARASRVAPGFKTSLGDPDGRGASPLPWVKYPATGERWRDCRVRTLDECRCVCERCAAIVVTKSAVAINGPQS